MLYECTAKRHTSTKLLTVNLSWKRERMKQHIVRAVGFSVGWFLSKQLCD